MQTSWPMLWIQNRPGPLDRCLETGVEGSAFSAISAGDPGEAVRAMLMCLIVQVCQFFNYVSMYLAIEYMMHDMCQ